MINWFNECELPGGIAVEKYCSGLIDILQSQINIYRELLSLSLEKTPVLVKGNIAELERITKEEESLIIKVGRLEEQRQVLHNALAGHFALSPEELSISELVNRIDEQHQQKFQQAFDEIKAILHQITEVNDGNTELINSSLDFVNFSLNLLTSPGTTPFYKDEEHKKSQAAAKIFDRTV